MCIRDRYQRRVRGVLRAITMVKLDVSKLRYMSQDQFRVLTAIEIGMKNHEVVPVTLIERIARLQHGGARTYLGHLLRDKLIAHDSKKYDGYYLTYRGYDHLALKAFVNRGLVAGMGRQIGCGKESDVFEVVDDEGRIFALKLHRLGRTSFRAVKSKRDYHPGKSKPGNWLMLSRLAALKEFSYMKALHANGFKVPIPVDANRHAVLMELVNGVPLNSVIGCPDPLTLYLELQELLFKLARVGLVHCDFNEFNIMMHEDGASYTLIDFPQIVSTSHVNAAELFMRDVQGLYDFFTRKFNLQLSQRPEDHHLPEVNNLENVALDKELKSSGFHQDVQSEFNAEILELLASRDPEVEQEEAQDEDSSDFDSDISDIEDEDFENEPGAPEGSSESPVEDDDAAAAALLDEFELAMQETEQERSEEVEAAAAAVADKMGTNSSQAASPPKSPLLQGVDHRLNPQGAINRALGADVDAARERAQEIASKKATKDAIRKGKHDRHVRDRVKKTLATRAYSGKEGSSRNRNKLKGREKKKSVSTTVDAFWG
eukprot:TRINITY_DN43678_c0_g1_i2.p1 TRINITY_DN43678_c0_g1~~TRINITY_DN43678_c0_g1_i2.p1  ORF type:complete len:544 (-),score=162.54 TRINITY_DN43678_c0_g1_i2:482-2113(-)